MSEHTCPHCGARVFRTDHVCMDCGKALLRLAGAAPPSAEDASADEPVPQASETSDLTITLPVGYDEDARAIAVPVTDDITAGPSVMRDLTAYFDKPDKEWGISASDDELKVILLGHDWQWAEFDEWHSKFQQAGYFPDSWRGLEYLPDPPLPETRGRLDTFTELSKPARQVLVWQRVLHLKSMRIFSPFDASRSGRMRRKHFEEAMGELERVGWATLNVPLAARLTELKKDQMKQVAEKYGVATGGTKAVLGKRLAQEVDDDLLRNELPPDKRHELWGIGPVFGDLDDPYVDFELSRIRLLASDVQGLIESLNCLYEAVSLDAEEILIEANELCPCCSEHVNECISVAEIRDSSEATSLPPYHPGCQCRAEPKFDDDMLDIDGSTISIRF